MSNFNIFILFYISYFKNYYVNYYGATGSVSNVTKIFPHGRCEELDSFPSSMEGQFRQLGLKVKLVDAKWYLLSDYTVCKEGEKLSPDQSKMIVINFFIIFNEIRNI